MEDRMMLQMQTLLQTHINQLTTTNNGGDNNHNNEREEHANNLADYPLYNWSGQLHPVPNNFKLPVNINTSSLWTLYFHGDNSSNPKIPPYKVLKQFDISANDLTYFSKARFVVNVIATMAFKAGLFMVEGQDKNNDTFILSSKQINFAISNLSFAESRTVYNEGFDEVILRVHPNSQRNASICFTTLYKRIKMYDKTHQDTKLGDHIKK
jgi:hypothetical protein